MYIYIFRIAIVRLRRLGFFMRALTMERSKPTINNMEDVKTKNQKVGSIALHRGRKR